MNTLTGVLLVALTAALLMLAVAGMVGTLEALERRGIVAPIARRVKAITGWSPRWLGNLSRSSYWAALATLVVVSLFIRAVGEPTLALALSIPYAGALAWVTASRLRNAGQWPWCALGFVLLAFAPLAAPELALAAGMVTLAGVGIIGTLGPAIQQENG